MIFGSSGFTRLFSVIFLDWRLPQCRCMVSHGGAGVLHSTLRAGIPAIIAPFFGDQFFHAKLIQARELGDGDQQPVATSMGWVFVSSPFGEKHVFFLLPFLGFTSFWWIFCWMNLFF